jgi:L,D-transpeptidase ErfK/SrfK
MPPTLPEPVPTHRFEIEPTTDIVGVVQKTRATKEDTLTDIARRFNVGYEEIVRANPSRPVVAGREPGDRHPFAVHPPAPREGIVIMPRRCVSSITRR